MIEARLCLQRNHEQLRVDLAVIEVLTGSNCFATLPLSKHKYIFPGLSGAIWKYMAIARDTFRSGILVGHCRAIFNSILYRCRYVCFGDESSLHKLRESWMARTHWSTGQVIFVKIILLSQCTMSRCYSHRAVVFAAQQLSHESMLHAAPTATTFSVRERRLANRASL